MRTEGNHTVFVGLFPAMLGSGMETDFHSRGMLGSGMETDFHSRGYGPFPVPDPPQVPLPAVWTLVGLSRSVLVTELPCQNSNLSIT